MLHSWGLAIFGLDGLKDAKSIDNVDPMNYAIVMALMSQTMIASAHLEKQSAAAMIYYSQVVTFSKGPTLLIPQAVNAQECV